MQGTLAGRLRGSFRPYTLDQIHSTVIRLDGAADPQTGLAVNQRYRDVTGAREPMDLARALEIITARLTPPLRVRLGGWAPAAPAPFTSRGQHPYQRMFSVQGDAFVLVGWPASTAAGAAARPLDDLRRELATANIAHLYHGSPHDVDNDFHLVVGHHNSPPAAAAKAAAAVRSALAGQPMEVGVGAADIAIIAADTPALAPARFVGRLPLDPACLAVLYR
jgi:hypothetical protein